MTTHDPAHALAASLDIAHVHELAQLSEQAFWDYARTLAAAPTTPEESLVKKHEEYLECVAGVAASGRFLFPLSALYSIMPPPHHYTSLPGKPEWMIGLAQWRGTAIVVVDLSLYLTGSSASEQEVTIPESLLIAHDDDVSLGLLVRSQGNMLSTPDILSVVDDEQDSVLATNPWYALARQMIAAGIPGIAGISADAIVLDVPALLADIVRQIEMTTSYG